MALSPDGKTLLTNGMDDTVRAWDVQPFVSGDRMLKIFLGREAETLLSHLSNPDPPFYPLQAAARTRKRT